MASAVAANAVYGLMFAVLVGAPAVLLTSVVLTKRQAPDGRPAWTTVGHATGVLCAFAAGAIMLAAVLAAGMEGGLFGQLEKVANVIATELGAALADNSAVDVGHLADTFVALAPRHPEFVLFHAMAAALALSMLGFVAGLWAAKWDHLAFVTNFTIMPLTFLSGAFYSIDRLFGVWRAALQFNPIFYMVDGFRYGFIGQADGSPALGLVVMAVLNLALALVCYRLVVRGYKLKS